MKPSLLVRQGMKVLAPYLLFIELGASLLFLRYVQGFCLNGAWQFVHC